MKYPSSSTVTVSPVLKNPPSMKDSAVTCKQKFTIFNDEMISTSQHATFTGSYMTEIPAILRIQSIKKQYTALH
jgi:hypothetical protein